MPITSLILLVAISQIMLYFLLDKANKKHGKTIIFLLVLMAHLFIFPSYYYPKPIPGEINCGLPALGITLVFWLFGSGVTTMIHVVYFFIKKHIRAFENDPTST